MIITSVKVRNEDEDFASQMYQLLTYSFFSYMKYIHIYIIVNFKKHAKVSEDV